MEGKEKPRIKYTGKIYISDLATTDKSFSNDFVNWKQLYFDRVDAGVNPFYVNVKGVSLTDFYARMIINPDGTMNIRQIFDVKGKEAGKTAGKENAQEELPEKTAKVEKPEEAVRSIKIGKVTLQGGTIDFTDRFIKPNYSARMLNIGGSVIGLSSEEISRAASTSGETSDTVRRSRSRAWSTPSSRTHMPT